MIESFEQKWWKWSIDDTVEWFNFQLRQSKHCNANYSYNSNSTQNGQDYNYDSDYEIENYSSGEQSKSDNDEKDETVELEIDFEFVESRMKLFDFSAGEDLPFMQKSHHFKRFGFKNPKDCELLCQFTKRLIQKYPRNEARKKENMMCNKKSDA